MDAKVMEAFESGIANVIEDLVRAPKSLQNQTKTNSDAFIAPCILVLLVFVAPLALELTA